MNKYLAVILVIAISSVYIFIGVCISAYSASNIYYHCTGQIQVEYIWIDVLLGLFGIYLCFVPIIRLKSSGKEAE